MMNQAYIKISKATLNFSRRCTSKCESGFAGKLLLLSGKEHVQRCEFKPCLGRK